MKQSNNQRGSVTVGAVSLLLLTFGAAGVTGAENAAALSIRSLGSGSEVRQQLLNNSEQNQYAAASGDEAHPKATPTPVGSEKGVEGKCGEGKCGDGKE